MIQKRPAAVPTALLLLWASPSVARAEDAVSYKFENYTETGGRVGVQTQGLDATQDLGTDSELSVTSVVDAIAGATPTGLPAPSGSGQVPLAHLSDHRKAWEIDASRQFSLIKLTAGFSESREHDYVSKGWSLNSLTDFNQKNTTVLLGIAGHTDSVETFYDPEHAYVGKRAFSAIAGVTQLLDPRMSVTLNVTWSRETGYLSDQYKLVQQVEELLPGDFFTLVFAENRPSAHDSGDLFASIERAFPKASGSLEASYRLYGDTYGIVANTAEVLWIQKLGNSVTLTPNLRVYEQDAAKFYFYDLSTTSIVPTTVPNPAGPAYSSDYRLSSLYTTTLGLKATWKARDWLQFDVAYARYAMRGRDGVTPQSAYPSANILTFGAKVSW